MHTYLKNRKFVTTKAGDHVTCANGISKSFAHHNEQLIADRMSQRVVYVLEIIEIKIKDSEALPVSACPIDCLLESFIENATIGQIRQLIGSRKLRYFLFGYLASGNIANVANKIGPPGKVHNCSGDIAKKH